MARQNTTGDAKTMIFHGFLIVNQNGQMKLSRSAPSLDANEVSIALKVAIPRAIFTKPALSAEIEIPAEAGNPASLTAKTVNNIKDAVKQATGMELAISIVNQ